ncbi:precorrin-3B synthase [Actinoplanes sp. SE50]|uniref:precorrin-3B synthase n=1 Tax=unclassified Actinoplanes TaxID=2626549 RepID=UPI00023ECF65|nr:MULTISPECIES: precorrin-3B synthase [unclassified Actinoplanes]AEV87781.1 precorrin-3B synthase [Actinoplanes sp. SE50/110]ATO86183.1 precorrin-3B synthase [Actinoplanes sp. SE50]SLM03597.1 precorrin-3B synthase [Actinoplanes sp. SE50/110]
MSRLRQSDTDACPGALRLHAAADGLLARVRLPGGMLTGAQLGCLRELAEEFGDRRLELTSRANLQLRALPQDRVETVAARLRAAGLLPSATHDAVRNIAAPPMASDTVRDLVRRLDAAICADPGLAALPGKFLFALGPVPLAADVTAVPLAGSPAGDRFALTFGGRDTGLRVTHDSVIEALLASAHAFLAEREAQRGGGAAAWRLRELTDGAARVSARVAAALGLATAEVPAGPAPGGGGPAATDPLAGVTTGHEQDAAGALVGVVTGNEQDAAGALVGVVTGNGQFAAGALVPLGRLESRQSRLLAEAERLVVTPWRGVLVPGLTPEDAAAWAGRMAATGLVVTPTSRWTGVTACAGRPGCAKSRADIRADAEVATGFADGLPVHWAGCERACGSPAGPHVRVEATAASPAAPGSLGAGGAGYTVTRRADPETVVEVMPAGALGDVVAAARRG